MTINLQTILENEAIALIPLQEADFSTLYALASDPEIWKQHPNKDRWKEDVFRIFFEGAIQSGGAFNILNKANGATIGCTRFYDHDSNEHSIFIGYTFYGTAYWGKGVNLMVKRLMLNYIFQFVDHVSFHIGANNIRSQIAIGRLGAIKSGEQEVAYYGEDPKHNLVYGINKTAWKEQLSSFQ